MLMAAETVVEFSDPSEVSPFMPCELSWSRPIGNLGWVFWSRENNELKHLVESVTVKASIQSQTIKEMIKGVLQELITLCGSRLFQFWAPVVAGNRTFLTIADQPFLLSNLHVGLCSYRRQCLDCLLPVDDDQLTIIGPPERVFRRGLPEFCSSCFQFYRNEEFSQHVRDTLQSIGVEFYAAVPLFMPPFYNCVGVLEILSPVPLFSLLYFQILPMLEKEFNLISCDNKYGFHEDIPETAVVADSRNLWRICLDRPKIVAFDIWLPSRDASCLKAVEHDYFAYEKKGEGVVGRAFASQSACFCMDVTQLCINKYPWLPIARKLGHPASFAICLQNRHASDKILVLELFLHLDGSEDPKACLIELLMKMKTNFKHPRTASSGDKLFIKVIKTSPLDQLESFELCNPFSGENSAAEHAQFLERRRELPQIDYLPPEQIEYGTTRVLASETDTSLLLERAKKLLRGNKESAEIERENSSSSSSSSVCNYKKLKVFMKTIS